MTTRFVLYLLFSFSLLLFPTSIYSVDFDYKYLDSRLGLSSDNVTDFCQDSEGFMWVGTLNGLNLFTGKHFRTYKTYSENKENVTAVAESQNGDLWIGTIDNGITVFNRKTNKSRKFTNQSKKNSILDDKVNDILCDSKGRVWIATSSGLNRYDEAIDSMFSYGAGDDDRFLRTQTFKLYEDAQGRIFISTWSNSICCYDDKDGRFHQIKKISGGVLRKSWSFCGDIYGNLWVGTWGDGLYKIRITDNYRYEELAHISVVNEHVDKDITFDVVYDLTIDKHNRLWLGTDVGLGLINLKESPIVNIEWIPLEYGDQKFMIKDITKVFIDAEESLWIGTFEFGVCMLRPDGIPFKTYQIYNGKGKPSTNSFSAFWEYDNQLFVGVQSIGYGVYDLVKKQFTPYQELEKEKNFSSFYSGLNAIVGCSQIDDDYQWLLTRYMGLIRKDLHTGELFQVPVKRMAGNNLSYVVEQDRIWMCNGGPSVVLLTKDTLLNTADFPYRTELFGAKDLPHSNISNLYLDSDSKLWLTSLSGGVVYATKVKDSTYCFKLLDVPGSEEFNKIKVQSVLEDSKKNMWFGTINNGLWCYSRTKQELFSYNSGVSFAELTVFAIEEDDIGNIWASTNGGLLCVLEASGQTINYTVDDGIQGNTFIKNASYKDHKGNLYFGGYHGFNVVNPHTITYNTYIPPLAFTSLMIDNMPEYIDYTVGEPLVLTHYHKSFSIEFDALSYQSSDNNHFLYKLEGFDDNWVSSENDLNRVVYGKLPPGKYTFKLKGSNNNGVWNNVPLKLNVEVKQSPYKTLGAYLVYFLILLVILSVIYYFWHGDMLLKKSIKDEQEERLRANELNQFKLRFFTNISHELLTPLAIISNATEKVNEDKKYSAEHFNIISQNTIRLLHLINQLLDFRKTETGMKKIKVSENHIEGLVNSLYDNFTSLCEKKNISFVLKGAISENLWFDGDFLDKIFHNILSNAFKYTQKDGEISFSYSLKEDNEKKYLFVQVSDTGTGILEGDIEKIFTRFYRSEGNQKVSGAGIGLAFTHSLVELHKGRIWAENNDSIGASFFVEIPVYKEAYTEDEIFDFNESQIFASEFDEEVEQKTQTIGVQKILSEDHKHKILIVEDNDDMRTIIKSYFENQFTVYEAENGVKALKLLEISDVDIVISDVMMPEMDGIMLCRKLKSSLNTSHIPVILMTAKNTYEDKIEGYKALADSYLSKPVNLNMLNVRVCNILSQREALKKTTSYDDMAIIDKSGVGNLDKEFLENVNRIIKENIGNNDFRVSHIYNAIGSSESVTFRKLKALTGKSPNQYMREVKLNIAAKMIRKGGKPVEVCYLSGFSDPSYFSSSFKKQFGVSPSKYMKG